MSAPDKPDFEQLAGTPIRGQKMARTATAATNRQLPTRSRGLDPERTNLLPALHLVQHVTGYLPAWAMERVGLRLHIPVTEVHGVASGYTEFRFEAPPGELVQICNGLSCRLAGADALLMQARQSDPGAVETIPCAFLCSLAPVIVKGGQFVGRVDGDRLRQVQEHGR
jgi:NADH:ubiquinone oxidoreductase 24 kD subunit